MRRVLLGRRALAGTIRQRASVHLEPEATRTWSALEMNRNQCAVRTVTVLRSKPALTACARIRVP